MSQELELIQEVKIPSIGERVIRTASYNQGNEEVLKLLKKFADLYTEVHAISTYNLHDQESARLANESKQHLETAAMYAVKALTVPKD